MKTLLPAIDLMNSEVVRLTRGNYEEKKVYSNNPLAIAKQWVHQGASWLHLVDLDAALHGKPINHACIQNIAQFLHENDCYYEIGGGIRTEEHLTFYLERAGADRVILGTIAYQNPEFVKLAAQRYPGKIAVGIDVKDGKVATQGWTQVENFSATELAKKFEDFGVACIVYTDIQRDGMLSGFNFEGIEEFANSTSLPIIIAGGLKDLEDVKHLKNIPSQNVLGASSGKAIYEGSLNLKEALEFIQQ